MASILTFQIEVLPSGAPQFTWAQIAASIKDRPTSAKVAASDEPRYTVIHRKVYDLSGDFLSWHPGGAVGLSQLGEDASGAFDAFHPDSVQEMLACYYAGDLAAGEPSKQNDFATELDSLRTNAEAEGLFNASLPYYGRKFGEVCAITAAAWYTLYSGQGSWISVLGFAMLTGLFWQQCGWLSHDVLHHQLFKDRRYNNLAGYLLGNAFQGLSVAWWKYKHSMHHTVPNVHDADPDIDTLPFLAWSEQALELFSDIDEAHLAKFMVSHQPILYFPLLSIARISWVIQSVLWQTSKSNLSLYPTEQGYEVAALAIHWTAYFAGTIFCAGLWRGLLALYLAQGFGGIMLAAVFSVNHNGMPIVSKDDSATMSFYQLSVITGRNVLPGPLVSWFTGGLNYQIEHHIFPSLPRHNFHLITERVGNLCRKHNIPYHQTTLWGGLTEVVARLARVSGVVHGLEAKKQI
jgi:fatty acid desaturase/predicted heme/steroid binding protein